MNQSILIVGVNGFIGQGLLRYFKNLNFKTIGISKNSNQENLLKPDLLHHLKLPSLGLKEILQEHKPSLVVNASGKSSVDYSIQNPVEDFMENTNVTIFLLNALREVSAESKFIYLSSASVYGNPKDLPVSENAKINPISPYGYHKYIGEMICDEFSKLYGIHTASLRIFSAYGNGLRKQVIYDICKKAISSEIIQMKGTGKESRDFIHIEDLSQAILLIYKSGKMEGEFYNIGTGEEITIQELVQLVLKIASIKKEIHFTNIIHEGSPFNWRADISKIKNLGFKKSVSIESGIESYINWFQESVA